MRSDSAMDVWAKRRLLAALAHEGVQVVVQFWAAKTVS